MDARTHIRVTSKPHATAFANARSRAPALDRRYRARLRESTRLGSPRLDGGGDGGGGGGTRAVCSPVSSRKKRRRACPGTVRQIRRISRRDRRAAFCRRDGDGDFFARASEPSGADRSLCAAKNARVIVCRLLVDGTPDTAPSHARRSQA